MTGVCHAVYCDGGVIGRNPSPIGMTYAWCHVDIAGVRVNSGSGVVLAPWEGLGELSNNVSELLALLAGLENTPAGWGGVVYSDSQITLGRFFKHWKLRGIPEALVVRKDALWTPGRLNHATLRGELLAGHPTREDLLRGRKRKNQLPVSIQNVWCDKACQLAAANYLEKNPR